MGGPAGSAVVSVVVASVVCIADVVVVTSVALDDGSAAVCVSLPDVKGEFVVCVSMLSGVENVNISPVALLTGFEFMQVAMVFFLYKDFKQLIISLLISNIELDIDTLRHPKFSQNALGVGFQLEMMKVGNFSKMEGESTLNFSKSNDISQMFQ